MTHSRGLPRRKGQGQPPAPGLRTQAVGLEEEPATAPPSLSVRAEGAVVSDLRCERGEHPGAGPRSSLPDSPRGSACATLSLTRWSADLLLLPLRQVGRQVLMRVARAPVPWVQWVRGPEAGGAGRARALRPHAPWTLAVAERHGLQFCALLSGFSASLGPVAGSAPTSWTRGHAPLAQVHLQQVVNSPEDGKAAGQHQDLGEGHHLRERRSPRAWTCQPSARLCHEGLLPRPATHPHRKAL